MLPPCIAETRVTHALEAGEGADELGVLGGKHVAVRVKGVYVPVHRLHLTEHPQQEIFPAARWKR